VNEATHDRINELASQAADAWNTIGEELLSEYTALEGTIADGLRGEGFERTPETGQQPD
jgi:hypothetical protein